MVERLQRRRQPALDSPGRRFCYNNTGYVLLAEVVSWVFQRPIGPLASERIFRPLAMTRTWLSAVAPIPTIEPTPPGTLGDGGLWTTVVDLIGYLNALNGRPPRSVSVTGRLAAQFEAFGDGRVQPRAESERLAVLF